MDFEPPRTTTKSDTIDQQSFMIDEKNPEKKEGKSKALVRSSSSSSRADPDNNSAQNVSPENESGAKVERAAVCVAGHQSVF